MESFKSTDFCSLPDVSKIPKSKWHSYSRQFGSPNISHNQDFDIDVLSWSMYNLTNWERLELGKFLLYFLCCEFIGLFWRFKKKLWLKSALTNTKVRCARLATLSLNR